MISSVKPLVLIPAAGFGRRMGSPMSKELLPLRAGRPLIEAPLEWCADRHWPVLVITRQEKINLIEYLSRRENASDGEGLSAQRPKVRKTSSSPVDTLLVSATKDWPDTLLASGDHWHEWNLVLLPDVDFAPLEILDQMAELMNSPKQLIVASHDVGVEAEARRAWGFLRPTSTGVMIAEKPLASSGVSRSRVLSSGVTCSGASSSSASSSGLSSAGPSGPDVLSSGFSSPSPSSPGSANFDSDRERAWGIFAFHKSIGTRLLKAQSDSSQDHHWRHLEISTAELQLKHFRDLTRECSI